MTVTVLLSMSAIEGSRKGRVMQEKIRALLIGDRDEPMGSLRRSLEGQSIETQTAETCNEAARMLWQQPPHLVLVSPRLPDGSWEDIVLMAAKAPMPVNVIVVSDIVDIAFYLEAIQVGAYDFIVPPLSRAEFAYLVGSAIENVLRRRDPRTLGPLPATTIVREKKTSQATARA
jgi:DNA-binding NtrC family response regulator